MAISHVSTLAQQDFTMSRLQTLQARIATANYQVTSGIKAQRYSGIAQDAQRLVSLEASYTQTERFVDNNKAVDRRLQTMETNVGSLLDIATSFRATLVQATSGGNASDMALVETAQSLLAQVGSLLNVRDEGRYLFAGSRTDTAPVDFNDPDFGIPPNTYPSAADTGYYQGNDQTLTVHADANLEIDYGLQADDPAFEKLIRALQLTATNPGFIPERLTEAARLVGQAVEELPDVQARIGFSRGALEASNKKHDETLLYIEGTIQDVKYVDIPETLTRLQSDSLALQASYSAIAQLRNISLINFL